MEKKITKLAIVEDQQDMREFLIEIFDNLEEFTVLSAYSNAEEAIHFLPKSDIDLVIVDIGLPGESGIDCVRKVKEIRPDILFMMYTVFDRDNKIFDSLKAGANGYLLKSSKPEEIIPAVRELIAGGSPMSPEIARKITNFFFKGSPTSPRFKELKLLGKREAEVLDLLSKGFLYKEIAPKMNIKIGTVKQHIHSVYKKLHVQNRTEAINKYLGR